MMIESYKFRLYPTDDQKVLLAKHFGSVRYVYNWALDYETTQYATTKKHLGWTTLAASGAFKKLKEENPWLYEIGATTLQNTVGHLDKAFQKFFRNKGGFPKHKSKYDNNQSFEVPKGLQLFFKDGKIQIPKFIYRKGIDNRIKCVFCRKVKKGNIGTATISKNPSNQYFVSFIVHTNEKEKEPINKSEINIENSIGIDFGLKHFLTLSDGRVFDSPEFLKKSLEKLTKEQKKLSRKKKKSDKEEDIENNINQGKNREKQRLKVARIYQHVSDQRADFLHNLSTSLADESQVSAICIEDLNLKGMSKLWGRKVHDLGYGTFVRMLEYKMSRRGKYLIKIGRFEPSTQICCKCGYRKRMSLKDRIYKCDECGNELDRDLNAAINIRNFGMRDIIKKLENTEATSGINACGDERSGFVGQPTKVKRSSKKQENMRDSHPQSQPSSVAG